MLPNLSTPGTALISLYGATPPSGPHALVYINFLVLGTYGQQTPLHIATATVNEGQILTVLDDGLFTVNCNDGNPCTTESFNGSTCVYTNTAAGTACGDPSSSACDNPDVCDGAGACVPNHVSDGTACGVTGTECKNQDSCLAGVCHDNGYKPAGTGCGDPSSGECDLADSCNGSGTCLPNHATNGTSCA